MPFEFQISTLELHIRYFTEVTERLVKTNNQLQKQLDEAHEVIGFAYDNEHIDLLNFVKAVQKRARQYNKKWGIE